MPSPTLNGLLISNKTPLAETLRVRALCSAVPEETTTGRVRGKRTAQRTSWGFSDVFSDAWGAGTTKIPFLISSFIIQRSCASERNLRKITVVENPGKT